MNTTKTAFHSLVEDICADPTNDGLRLIAADWLEDNGRPDYAEFIRLQMELEAATLVHLDRISNLLRSNFWWWFGTSVPMDYMPRPTTVEVGLGGSCVVKFGPLDTTGMVPHQWLLKVERGFISSVELTLVDCEKWLPWLVRRQPIQRVRISNRRPAYRGFEDDKGWYWFSSKHPSLIVQQNFTGSTQFVPHHLIDSEESERVMPSHPTEELAWEWISDRLLTWAKSQPDNGEIT